MYYLWFCVLSSSGWILNIIWTIYFDCTHIPQSRARCFLSRVQKLIQLRDFHDTQELFHQEEEDDDHRTIRKQSINLSYSFWQTPCSITPSFCFEMTHWAYAFINSGQVDFILVNVDVVWFGCHAVLVSSSLPLLLVVVVEKCRVVPDDAAEKDDKKK